MSTANIAKNHEFTNIRDLRKQTPRAKAGVATHIVGTYDFRTHMVTSALSPIEIGTQEGYVLHNKELITDASDLLTEIKELTNRMTTVSAEENELHMVLPELSESSIDVQSQLSDAVHQMAESYKGFKTPVVWRHLEEDKARIKHWLCTDVPDELFDMGGLKLVAQLFDIHNPGLDGTDDEKAKYEKLQMLSHKLLLLDTRTNYLKTFEGMYFIPLAIQNISATEDKDIRVVVNVESGEIVEPDEHLIWEDYEGIQGLLCRDDEDKTDVGIICELFCLNEDGFIQTEDIPYDPSRHIPKAPIFTLHGLSQPEKTEEDYKQELEEFIASTGGRGYYEFDVSSLRPGECRWLCCGMLIRPIDGNVKLHYQIYSARSMGDLSGILDIKTD